MLLSIAYFPPVGYFSVIRNAPDGVFLDTGENYQKQSYRNRCRILTANGVEDLRFPIVHDGTRRITEVRVDYSTPWVSKTRTAIDSAYYSSPFFEYYRDSLYEVLNAGHRTLWELDSALLSYFCSKIGLQEPMPVKRNDVAYLSRAGVEGQDLRDRIHPKKEPLAAGCEYWQVFSDRYGFVADLSIMDLLFNEGPGSISIL